MTPLTAERVRYIRARLAEDNTLVEIAAKLRLSPRYVSELKCQHITPTTAVLMRRWREVHDIGGIGERAVRETA